MIKLASLPSLFSRLQTILPKSLPPTAPHILAASTLTACGHPQSVGPIFTCLTARLSQREAHTISLQMRDILLKQWTLIGIPLVISAVPSLAAAEIAAGYDFPSDLAPKYAMQDGKEAVRGEKFMRSLYQGNLDRIFATWGSHKDTFVWLEKSPIYGLFLSDHEVLNELESELVILSSIMAQDLKGASVWHLRGLMRLGVTREDVRKVVKAIEECAAVGGKEGTGWSQWVDEVDPDDQAGL